MYKILPAALMTQVGVRQVLVEVGRVVERVGELVVPLAEGAVVLGVTVPFGCMCLDELPSLSDLFLSTAYSEINTTNKASSTRKTAAKTKRTFEGFRVSGSSSKPKEIDDGIVSFKTKWK